MESYRKLNLGLLGLLLFGGLLVIFNAVFIRRPCPSLTLFGKPCIFCGCTRDFCAFLGGHFSACRNGLSRVLFIGLLAEVIWRSVWVVFRGRRWVFWVDGAVHGVAAAGLMVFNMLMLVRV